jgi:O-antigen/teichoic acid export membrane protein
MKPVHRVFKNISAMLVAEALGFPLNFVLTLLLARYLGVEGFGNYSFVMAFVLVFQLIADAGLSNILIREIAVNREQLPYQLGVTKSLIWVFSLFTFLLIVLAVPFVRPEPSVRTALYIMGLAVLATVHAVGYTSVFRALEEMEYNAIGFVLHKVVLLLLVLAVIWLKRGLPMIAAAYLLANLFLWFFYYRIVRARYPKAQRVLDWRAWVFLLREAVPVGVAIVLRRVSWQVDILVLTAIGTARSVGLFSAPYKILQALNVLPQTISLPLFPIYARLAKESSDELFAAYERTLRLLVAGSVPFALLLAVFSPSIVFVLFGSSFQESHAALEILSLTLLFLFPTSQFIYLFSALGKQHFYTSASLVGLAANVALDFLLIPKLDFVGAALATLLAEMLLFATGIVYVKRLHRGVSLVRALGRPLAAGLVMLAVILPFRSLSSYLHVPAACLGILIYVLTAFAFGAVSRGELRFLRGSLPFFRKAPVEAPGSSRPSRADPYRTPSR